jgi:hypothetical protein
MTAVQLRESAVVVLNGSGNGTAKVGPLTARETWHPDNAHVSANPNPVNEAQCSIYIGDSPIASNFRDATFTGSSGDSSDRINADMIKSGQYVFAVWSGGDANVTATLTVTGTKDL